MNTAALIRYDAAIHALAECKAVDEVKAWADKAAAMQAYGRMAKDKTLEVDAAEIRIRAERRLGELIAGQKSTEGLNKGGRPAEETGPQQVPVIPRLADAGISKNLSSRAQKVAAVPTEQFEREIKDWKGRVTKEGARVSARLEAAGEKELKRQGLRVDGGADLSGLDEAFAGGDVVADLQRQVAELSALVSAIEATDPKAEALKWRQAYQVAERRMSEHMATIDQREKHIKFLTSQLRRCGKAIGQDDIDKIAPTVEALARGGKKVAA